MAKWKWKRQEELYDLSIDLETDSEQRFGLFDKWQHRYVRLIIIGMVLVLGVGLGVFYWKEQNASSTVHFQSEPASRIPKIELADEESSSLNWNYETIEQLLDKDTDLNLTAFIDKYGKPNQVTTYDDSLALSYHWKHTVSKSVMIFFKTDSETDDYSFSWLSYAFLTSEEFPVDETREFALSQSDYDRLVINQTTYQDAIALLGLPHQSLVSGSYPPTFQGLQLSYVQSNTKKVELTFIRDKQNRMVLTQKGETVWSN